MSKPLTELEGLFKALADETRLRILGLLLTGEVCVCHIHESLRIPQPKASRHLAYLRRAGLVDLPGLRRMMEAAGFHGHQEVEIFSAENWWKRPGDEVLHTCIERYNTVC